MRTEDTDYHGEGKVRRKQQVKWVSRLYGKIGSLFT